MHGACAHALSHVDRMTVRPGGSECSVSLAIQDFRAFASIRCLMQELELNEVCRNDSNWLELGVIPFGQGFMPRISDERETSKPRVGHVYWSSCKTPLWSNFAAIVAK